MKRSITGLFAVFLCIAIFTLPAALAGAENKAKGKLTVDGKAVDITQVYAYAKPGFFDKKKQDVVVLMCDAPVTPETVQDVFAFDKLIDSGRLHCVQQTINTEKQVINFEVRHKRFRIPVSGGSSYQVFEAKTFSDNTISGRARTTALQKSFDDVPYSYDITFSATFDPMPGEKTAKKLPSGGGEPGKAYMAFIKAIRDKDFAGVRKWHSGAAKEPDSEIAKGIEFMSDTADKNTKISGGYATAELATLYVSFVENKETQYGEIEMIRSKDGAWQVGKQSWSNTPPGKK